MVNDEIVPDEKKKPVLDEQTLAKLLEAAYVLQEHNRELQQLELGFALKRDKIEAEDHSATSAKRRKISETAEQADYTTTLAQIVETQHRIQLRKLDLPSAISLIAERVVEIGHAAGASIGILKDEKVLYRGVAGRRALPKDSEVPLEKALCVSSVRTGQVFRCVDVDPEVLLDSEECRRRGIQSLITVPVFHEGGVVGGLELYYSEQNAFTEQDVHTCQLMAGLVTEALARDEEISWKKSLADERAVMLEALEKLKPNLSALVEQPKNEGISTPSYTCRKCGHGLVAGEQFCGQCGTQRANDHADATPSGESMPVSLQEVEKDSADSEPRISEKKVKNPEPVGTELSLHTAPELSLDEMVESLKEPALTAESIEQQAADHIPQLPAELLNPELGEDGLEIPGEEEKSGEEENESQEVALVKPVAGAHWSSAVSARDYLEKLAAAKRSAGLARFWNARRGDIYLAIAVILVGCVIRWGIWSNHPVRATAAPNSSAATPHKANSDADLSLFDRMLISLGLAEAPEKPEDNGDPSTQVWVDLHTALYYCPGADLYGKTATGKYTTQRDAQLDQFQPAYRKVCK